MFDIWMDDIDLTMVVLIFSMIVLLPVQLLLCFKVKRKTIRLLPVVFLFITTIILTVKADAANGWTGLGYIVLAFFTGFMLLICGMGWGIWAITRLVKRIKGKKVEYKENKKHERI